MACGGDARSAAGICRILATRTTATGSANGSRPCRRDQADGSYRRCQDRPSLRRGPTGLRGRRQSWSFPDHPRCPDALGLDLIARYTILYNHWMSKRLVYRFPGDAWATLPEVGGKGLSLIEGARASLPIPPGFVLAVSFFDPWVSELKTTDAWTLFPAASEADLPKASAALKEIAAASRFTDEQRHVLMEALSPLEWHCGASLQPNARTSPLTKIPGRAWSISQASNSQRYRPPCPTLSSNPAAISREHSSRSNIARRRSARRLTRAVPTGGTSISIYLMPGFE